MTSPATHLIDSEPLDISFSEDMLSKLCGLFAEYGDAFSVFSPITKAKIHVLSHPEHVRHVLVTNQQNYTKGLGIERVGILLGNGIMVSEGEEWRRQRKMIQPAFHRDVIARMVAHIETANDELLTRWTACAKKYQQINLTQDMSEVTLRIVLKSIFGDDLARMSAPDGTCPFDMLTAHTERNLAFAYKFRSLSKLIMDCVNQRRIESRAHYDLLAMLMGARDRKSDSAMADKQLLDEVMTLIVAGHETTASALNWMWYLLSQNPPVESRLHAEIDAAPDRATMVELPYTRQVIDETLRLYPPGWLLTRRSIASDDICGYPVGPKADIFIAPYILHRHPAFWTDPERFDPDRFAPEQVATRNRYVYLPFALGPRACIGEQFALTEMTLHARTLAREIRLRYVGDTPPELECQVNLRTRRDIYMQPEKRH